MSTTYQTTFHCGHMYKIPAESLGRIDEGHVGLLDSLKEIPCPDCLKAAIAETLRNGEDGPHEQHIREDLRGIGTIPQPIAIPFVTSLGDTVIVSLDINECMHTK